LEHLLASWWGGVSLSLVSVAQSKEKDLPASHCRLVSLYHWQPQLSNHLSSDITTKREGEARTGHIFLSREQAEEQGETKEQRQEEAK
jgi:hypothetical protein